MLQVALTFVFGPLIVLVHGSIAFGWAKKTRGVLIAVQRSFMDASAGFSIPVAIATIVRLKQEPPFYEIAFLQWLLTMQFLSILSIMLAMAAARLPEDDDRQPFSLQRRAAIVLICLVEFGLYMGLVGHLRTSQAYWTSVQELGTACETYGSILPGFEYFHGIATSHTVVVPQLSPGDRIGLSGAGLRNTGIIFGLFLAGIVGLVVAAIVIKYSVIFIGAVLVLIFTEGREFITLGLMSLAFAIGSTYCASQMAHTRGIMSSIEGSDFEDNVWGFGQVIAVLLWVPLVFQSLDFLFVKFGV